MSIYTVKNGMTNAGIEDLLFELAQFINQTGVIATGDMLVAAQATPDMTVKVAVGRAVLLTSDGNYGYPVYIDAITNVTIASNSSGVAKIDAVVLYWDGAASSDANASNVAKLTTVRGTASATPTNAEIQTAVGASNPYLRLADVAVANGASSINAGNITDKRIYAGVNSDRVGVGASGHIVFTPPASKFVKTTVLRQDITANSYKNNSIMLTGWGYINGAAATNVTQAVTFGVTFAAIPVLITAPLSTKVTAGAPTVLSDFVGSDFTISNSITQTTSGFTENILKTTGNLTAAYYYGYSWIAIGEF